MLESYLIRGLLIGLIFGVPAGAIGALTIQRTLNSGFTAGLMTGLGSSAADILYRCVGVFGVTLVSDFLTHSQRPIRLLGGLLIVALGVHIFGRNLNTGSKSLTRQNCLFALPAPLPLP